MLREFYLNFKKKKKQARLQNTNHYLQCPSSPFPRIPCPAPKHKPPPTAVHKLLTENGSLPTSPCVTMVGLYQTLVDNERAQYPRTQHMTAHDQSQLPLLLCHIRTHADYSERWLDTMTFFGRQIRGSLRAKHTWALLHPPSWPSRDPAQWHWPRLFTEAKPPEGGLLARGPGPRTRKCREMGWEESTRRGKPAPRSVI